MLFITSSAVTLFYISHSLSIIHPCILQLTKARMLYLKLSLLLAAVVIFAQLADVAESGDADKFVNQVIYIESMRYRGKWLDSHHSGWLYFTDSPQREVIKHIWTKWIVRKGPGNTYHLESVRYPHHYLDAHHSDHCKATYTSYPANKNWARWYIERKYGDVYQFRSDRYRGSRLDAHHSGKAKVTHGSGIWSAMRIYQPSIRETRELVFKYDNSHGTTPVHTKFTEKLGISKSTTTTVSATVTAQIGAEIKGIFSASTSVSPSWQHSSTLTWQKEITMTIEVTVKPGTVKKIYQLQGTYGPYSVFSNIWSS